MRKPEEYLIFINSSLPSSYFIHISTMEVTNLLIHVVINRGCSQKFIIWSLINLRFIKQFILYIPIVTIYITVIFIINLFFSTFFTLIKTSCTHLACFKIFTILNLNKVVFMNTFRFFHYMLKTF